MSNGCQPAPVSVILPCHNEEPNIARVVRDCRRVLQGRAHQILVVDDGSSDRTSHQADRAGADVISLARNMGKGEALLAGARAARHELLLFMDGDGQDDPKDIPRLLRLFDGDWADLVIGSRFLGVLYPGAIHPLNRVVNQALTALIATLFRVQVTDSQAGFRALKRDPFLALGIAAREYDVETDMLLKALKAGWRVREVAVTRYPRGGSETGVHRLRHGVLILTAILRERLRP